jgi:hypothetical protein
LYAHQVEFVSFHAPTQLGGGHLFDEIFVSKADSSNFVLAPSFSEVKILHQAKFDSLRIRTRLGVGAFV